MSLIIPHNQTTKKLSVDKDRDYLIFINAKNDEGSVKEYKTQSIAIGKYDGKEIIILYLILYLNYLLFFLVFQMFVKNQKLYLLLMNKNYLFYQKNVLN